MFLTAICALETKAVAASAFSCMMQLGVWGFAVGKALQWPQQGHIIARLLHLLATFPARPNAVILAIMPLQLRTLACLRHAEQMWTGGVCGRQGSLGPAATRQRRAHGTPHDYLVQEFASPACQS